MQASETPRGLVIPARSDQIASACSRRPVPGAAVSTPMTWDELAGVTDLGSTTCSPEEQGAVELDYPKMPGEPPRVQPSKKVAEHWDEQGNRIEG